jgi:outer membrane protein OmpA-like peptidoglycan-associated protein
MALGGALAMAGCSTSKERVTLLSPSQAGKDAGGVVIEFDDGEGFVSEVGQQVKLRGKKQPYINRGFDKTDPFYRELMRDLPKGAARDYFYFNLGEGTLSDTEMDRLQAFLSESIVDRPGLEIEIAAHTDATGDEEVNDRVSDQRAKTVLGQVLERVNASQLSVTEDDIDVVASSWHWARSRLQPGEVGQPNRDYRVVVVTVR